VERFKDQTGGEDGKKGRWGGDGGPTTGRKGRFRTCEKSRPGEKKRSPTVLERMRGHQPDKRKGAIGTVDCGRASGKPKGDKRSTTAWGCGQEGAKASILEEKRKRVEDRLEQREDKTVRSDLDRKKRKGPVRHRSDTGRDRKAERGRVQKSQKTMRKSKGIDGETLVKEKRRRNGRRWWRAEVVQRKPYTGRGGGCPPVMTKLSGTEEPHGAADRNYWRSFFTRCSRTTEERGGAEGDLRRQRKRRKKPPGQP